MIASDQLRARLAPFGKWMYSFQLTDDVSTPLHVPWLQEVHDTRARMIFPFLDERFGGSWGSTSCLDIACNEGFFSFEVARRGAARVVGFDLRADVIAKAEFIREYFSYDNVSLGLDSIDRLTPVRYGTFELTFLLGLLYHLENPMDALRRVRAVTSGVCVIETQVLRGNPEAVTAWGSARDVRQLDSVIGIVEEPDYQTNQCASATGLSFVPSLTALRTMLRYAGFSKVTQLTPDAGSYEQFASGDRVILVAE